ncbi:hypothetical protein D9758_004170 [Tetrapyrgos nigripes]|uniref:Uncharacterized protein n=1 Tax=Tetrapyrgos nigripes TaxID=182062 RepID=A0A8H5GU81_9AGAR|nr:hypothetical protein D9758_004170 [Tetrapyrgos nigripes]
MLWVLHTPTGNYIIASNIGADGKLTPCKAVYTGGLGAHAFPDGVIDALNSQGSVAVNAVSNLLAVVNPGSHTVSLFLFDASNSTNLTLVGAPISSGGQFPTSVSFSADGKMLCALNAAMKSPRAPSLLSLKPNVLNQTTSATGPPGTVSQVFVSPDAKNIIVSVKPDDAHSGFLAVWDIINADSSLSLKGLPLDPSTSRWWTAFRPSPSHDIIDCSGQNRSASFSLDGQIARCRALYSKETGNYYLVDAGTSLAYEIAVDENLKGSTVNSYSTGNNTAPIDTSLATVSGRGHLYVLDSQTTEVTVLKLIGPGQAETIQVLDLAGPVRNAGLRIGQFLASLLL